MYWEIPANCGAVCPLGGVQEFLLSWLQETLHDRIGDRQHEDEDEQQQGREQEQPRRQPGLGGGVVAMAGCGDDFHTVAPSIFLSRQSKLAVRDR